MLAWLATGGIFGALTVLVIGMLRRSKSKAQLEVLRREIEQLGQALQQREFHGLLQAKETLEATLAALPDTIVVVDADAHVVAANALAEARFGAKPRVALEVLRLPVEVKEAIHACLHGRQTDTSQVDLARAVSVIATGGTRQMLPRVTPIQGPGGAVGGAVLVLSDVTELSRLDALRSELVAIASHELRTPLTTLRMSLLLLEEEAPRLGAREREILSTALGGVDQLSGTVDEFLDLTRIESGELKLNRDLVSVRSFVERCAEKIRATCAAAGIKLVVEIDGSAPATVDADAPRLEAVLRNLLSNAVKYTPAGGEVRLSVGCTQSANGLEIQVTDTGPGVPAEHRERIFEKFFRVEDVIGGTERKSRGSGIGLYLARQVVTAHQGELVCAAGPKDRGARFTLRIPVSRQIA